jgi:CRP-like cAMP-binding protein
VLHTLHKIKAIYPLEEVHLTMLVNQLKRIQLPKSHLIIQAGKLEPALYFIEQGIARAYLDDPDHRITFWFGMEGDIILSYNSYINGSPGYENIELLEQSIVYELNTSVLQQLYLQHPALANWGRKLAEIELIRTEERYIASLFKTAKHRYSELLALYPSLLQRVPLGHIASYLGVSQVTLSRIRAER